MDDIGQRIETQIQGIQAQTTDSLSSLVQRIADLELENSRLKRTIKNKTVASSKSTTDSFQKLGRMISIYKDATKQTQRPIDSTPFVVALIDGSKITVSKPPADIILSRLM